MRGAQANSSRRTRTILTNFAALSCRFCTIALLLFTVLFQLTSPIHAQNQFDTPNYWQQDVDAPINHLTLIDLEEDGFDEFVVISGEQTVEIIRGDGTFVWNEPLVTDAPVIAAASLTFIVTEDGDEPQRVQRLALISSTQVWVVDGVKQTIWKASLAPELTPVALHRMPINDQGEHALIVQYSNDNLHVYDRSGQLAWQYDSLVNNAQSTIQAKLLIEDIDLDGQIDLIYGTGREGDGADRSAIGYVNRINSGTGILEWRLAQDGPISALAMASFSENGPKEIAVGDVLGNLQLLSVDGDAIWRSKRTLNRPITSLISAEWNRLGRLLLAGTDAGKLVAYNQAGVRIWDKIACRGEDGQMTVEELRCPTASAGIIAELSAPPSPRQPNQPLQLAILTVDSRESAEIMLVDAEFKSLGQYPAGIVPNNAQLVDVNSDGVQELILANFTTLELLSASTSARTPLDNWDGYLLRRGQSTTMIAHDLDGDEVEELLVAAADRLHLLRFDGVLIWLRPIPGTISHLAVIDAPMLVTEDAPAPLSEPSAPPFILVTYETTDDEGNTSSFITLLRPDSSLAWNNPIEVAGSITALHVDNSDAKQPLIIYGTDASEINAIALSPSPVDPLLWAGDFFWTGNRLFGRAITEIGIVSRNERLRVAISTEEEVVLLSRDTGQNTGYVPIETDNNGYCTTGTDLHYLLLSGIANNVLCNGSPVRSATNNSQLCTDCWETELGHPQRTLLNQTQRFQYLPLSKTTFQQLPRIAETNLIEFTDGSEIDGVRTFDNVAAYVVGNFRGGAQQDVAIVSNGELWLDLNTPTVTQLDLGVNIIDAVAIQPANNESAGLVISADNGRIYLYQFQPNFPPLLTHPVIQRIDDAYNIQVSLFDVENSDIDVELQILNQQNGEWESKGVRTSNDNTSQLNWQLSDLPSAQSIQYRFSYREPAGDNVTLAPLAGPPPLNPIPWYVYLSLPAGILLAGLMGFILWRRRSQRPETYAKRIYKQIAQNPESSLDGIRHFYNGTISSNDQLLTLANEFRRNNNLPLANLVDGLYLLASQPVAGLPIVHNTLRQMQSFSETAAWPAVSRWQTVFGSAQTLIEAPTITELTLQKPLLDNILLIGESSEDDFTPYNQLDAVMDTFTNSERVESAEDRLTYLNDSSALLRKFNNGLALQTPTLNTRVTSALASRWMGLVGAEIESLRGRAKLEIDLRTVQIVPSAETFIVVELANTGRAPAEEINIILQDGAAKPVNSATKSIPYLAANSRRSVTFVVNLDDLEAQQFRLAFTINYSDRAQALQSLEYANMVRVLAPQGEYVPIMNPYSPGTPLRQNSPLFFGRTDLFNFIASEAKRLTQKHVLILVGQRRTGKTSALLRLGQHLPDQILPVYVDCQSLGVIPGMSAFFQDLAWQIADAIEMRGIDFELPDMAEINENPGNWFQRELIPAARAVLAEDTQILLVFDEFEALENLVDDDILPNTLFPYLRHLMQHGEKLSFIFVGTRRLEALTTNYWSVLFNIALYKEIDYLSRPASRQLMVEPTAPSIQYDDLAIDKVWRMTAGHPYFLQLVCYSAVKRANQLKQGYITISDINATISEMLQLGEVHFAYIWQASTGAQRAVLMAVAHLIDKELPYGPADIIAALKPYANSFAPREITKALNNLVERNIMHEVNDGATTLYALKIGLIGSWIEQTKSLTKLHSDQLSV